MVQGWGDCKAYSLKERSADMKSRSQLSVDPSVALFEKISVRLGCPRLGLSQCSGDSWVVITWSDVSLAARWVLLKNFC